MRMKSCNPKCFPRSYFLKRHRNRRSIWKEIQCGRMETVSSKSCYQKQLFTKCQHLKKVLTVVMSSRDSNTCWDKGAREGEEILLNTMTGWQTITSHQSWNFSSWYWWTLKDHMEVNTSGQTNWQWGYQWQQQSKVHFSRWSRSLINDKEAL